jgi:hypothetical protein
VIHLGEQLPPDHPLVIEALESRQEHYLSLPAFQAQALALFRGYKTARDGNDKVLPKAHAGFSRYVTFILIVSKPAWVFEAIYVPPFSAASILIKNIGGSLSTIFFSRNTRGLYGYLALWK